MQPQIETGDALGQVVFWLTIVVGILTSLQRGKTVGHFFQRIARLAVKDGQETSATNGANTDRAYLLALAASESARIGSVEKQVGEFKVEIQDDFDLLADKMRGMFDSALIGISNLRRDINLRIDGIEAKIVATNGRLDALAEIVNRMNDQDKPGGEA